MLHERGKTCALAHIDGPPNSRTDAAGFSILCAVLQFS